MRHLGDWVHIRGLVQVNLTGERTRSHITVLKWVENLAFSSYAVHPEVLLVGNSVCLHHDLIALPSIADHVHRAALVQRMRRHFFVMRDAGLTSAEVRLRLEVFVVI